MTQNRDLGPAAEITRDELDTGIPQSARVYDFLLGGKDNYEADRAVGAALIQQAPALPVMVRAQRRLLARMVEYLVVEAGIRQFLDIGTGIPTADNVHEVAQGIAPETRVVYVDNDPIVLAHARALMRAPPTAGPRSSRPTSASRRPSSRTPRSPASWTGGSRSPCCSSGSSITCATTTARTTSSAGWWTGCRRGATSASSLRPRTSIPSSCTRSPPPRNGPASRTCRAARRRPSGSSTAWSSSTPPSSRSSPGSAAQAERPERRPRLGRPRPQGVASLAARAGQPASPSRARTSVSTPSSSRSRPKPNSRSNSSSSSNAPDSSTSWTAG